MEMLVIQQLERWNCSLYNTIMPDTLKMYLATQYRLDPVIQRQKYVWDLDFRWKINGISSQILSEMARQKVR